MYTSCSFLVAHQQTIIYSPSSPLLCRRWMHSVRTNSGGGCRFKYSSNCNCNSRSHSFPNFFGFLPVSEGSLRKKTKNIARVSVPDCVLRAIVIIMAEGICRRGRIKFWCESINNVSGVLLLAILIKQLSEYYHSTKATTTEWLQRSWRMDGESEWVLNNSNCSAQLI